MFFCIPHYSRIKVFYSVLVHPSSGRPFPLQNCSVSNQTPDSLQVDCVEGFDGGLTQAFILEVLESSSLRLVRNMSLLVSHSLLFLPIGGFLPQFRPNLCLSPLDMLPQNSPVSFFVDNLQAETSYRILLFAVNPKGRSEPTIIDGVIFKGLKYTGLFPFHPPS